jgi:diguanylate cyclase (GGDEF)-like protein
MERIRWTIAQARHGESIAARRSRNRISGIFLGSGAILAFTALLVLPGWHVTHRPVLATIGILITIGSVSQIVFAARVPIAMNHLTSLAGTASIAAAQILAGFPVAIATVGLLYVWVAVFTAVFYTPVATTLHVAAIAVTQAAVFAYLGNMNLLPQVVVTVGTCITAAVIVSWLTADLRRQVTTDPLTELPNRRGLESILARNLALARRSSLPLTVAVVDIDGFKSLNDRHGHAAGDVALVECATAWRQALRATDTIARTGGDEFVVLMPDSDLESSHQIISRLQQATPSGLTCSAGLTTTDGRDAPDELLHRADSAMYRAKADRVTAAKSTTSGELPTSGQVQPAS